MRLHEVAYRSILGDHVRTWMPDEERVGRFQMNGRHLAALMTAIAIVALAPVPAVGQAPPDTGDQWTTPRTPDGQPDLQGIWTSATFTPLERPVNLAGKEFLTEEETAELTRDLSVPGADPLASNLLGEDEEQRRERLYQSKEVVQYDHAIWLTEKNRPKGLSSRRTSLIVDPPDGRIPLLTPEAQKREAERAEAMGFDSHEARSLGERCIMWEHEGPPILPAAYNDNLQIFQTSGYVAIYQEMSDNQVRIIPLDGRPHLPETIRQWPGDSRGHWEGDTLVVDTTNFTHKTHFKGSSEALHVVERFTRVDADTILYEFTVDDPTSWTQPWSAEFPLVKTEGPLYEYACHEGNYDLPNILGIARDLEKAAAEAAKKESK